MRIKGELRKTLSRQKRSPSRATTASSKGFDSNAKNPGDQQRNTQETCVRKLAKVVRTRFHEKNQFRKTVFIISFREKQNASWRATTNLLQEATHHSFFDISRRKKKKDGLLEIVLVLKKDAPENRITTNSKSIRERYLRESATRASEA